MSVQLALELGASPAPRFGNFIPGPNQEVLDTLRRWLRADLAEPVIYLWGVAGAGKTHLLRAAVDEALEAGWTAQYIDSPTALGPAVPEAGQLQLIAVDDVGEADALGQAALFSALIAAAEGRVRLLLAGSNAPVGLALRADVRTRIGASLVLHVKALTDEEKAEVLRQHARERGFALPLEGAQYLLRHNRRDLPGLMALLDAIDRYSLQAKRPVTLSLLREVSQADSFAGNVTRIVERRDPFGSIND